MRIGLDAKWFFEGPPSGRVVVRSLTRQFVDGHAAHEWVIFVDQAGLKRSGFPYSGPRVSVVPVWAGNNLLANMTSLRSAALAAGVDVLLCQNFAVPSRRLRQAVLVYDAIFATHPQFYTWIERAYFAPLPLLARWANRICTVSNSEKARLVSLGIARPEMTDVMHCGVDGAFKPRDRLDRAQLESVTRRWGLPPAFALYVGRLNARKNITNLLRAMARLGDEAPPLVIVGSKSWKGAPLHRTIQELGIGDRVHFTGALPFEDLVVVYALAKTFCFPSFEEGFGLPALEAMASGVPVVVSDLPVMREVCGDAAVYVDPHEPESIAEGLRRSLGGAGERERLCRAGLARATGFTWERAADEMLACLERAAS